MGRRLPRGNPTNYQYNYTRCFYIYATGSGRPHLGDLQFRIISMEEAKREWGNPRRAGEWETFAEKLMSGYHPAARGATPLDFCVSDVSRIVLRLLGDFWKFSDAPAAVTTKLDQGGMYFDLRRHMPDARGHLVDAGPRDPCRCISFFTREPADYRDERRDGMNFHVDFIELNLEGRVYGSNLLPVIIDPDVENKGGNPGP